METSISMLLARRKPTQISNKNTIPVFETPSAFTKASCIFLVKLLAPLSWLQCFLSCRGKPSFHYTLNMQNNTMGKSIHGHKFDIVQELHNSSADKSMGSGQLQQSQCPSRTCTQSYIWIDPGISYYLRYIHKNIVIHINLFHFALEHQSCSIVITGFMSQVGSSFLHSILLFSTSHSFSALAKYPRIVSL